MHRAVVVGCQKYSDPELVSLKHAEHDATAFAQSCQSILGVQPEQTVVLTSNASTSVGATRSNIVRALTPPRDFPERPENLYLFFSGHGFHSRNTGRDYLIPQDAVAASLEETALAVDTVIALLRRWSARNSVLFLDACRANLWSGKSIELIGNEAPIQESTRAPGFATFWSCSPGEKSFEADAIEYGIFSMALVEALSDVGKCKTIYELGGFLRKSVPRSCSRLSLPVQNPYLVIEPIEIQNTTLASSETVLRWQSGMVVGSEMRTSKLVQASLEESGTDPPLTCGFDFGTSHSAVTVGARDGTVLFVPYAPNRTLLPSVVAFLPDLRYYVGHKAVELSLLDPKSAVFNVKRHIGSDVVFNIHGRSFRPEEIASLLIGSLKANAEEFFQLPITSAIASAPANFTIAQCSALLRAYQLAGVKVTRLIGEPSAAGLATQPTGGDKLNTNCLVLDLGGGTFDVSVLEIGEGVWEVMASGGDRELGGIDYDEALLAHLERAFIQMIPAASISEIERSQLRLEATRAKVLLGSNEHVSVVLRDIEAPGLGLQNIEVVITREVFREIASILDERVKNTIQSTLEEASFRPEQLERVVLAGQGTKLFTLREMLNEMFSGIPIDSDHQENAVVLGLGRYLYTLKYRDGNVLLLDALPTALGIKCKESDHPWAGYDCLVSNSTPENIHRSIVLDKDTTIPVWKSLVCRVLTQRSSTAIMRIVELDSRGKNVEIELGTVEFPVPTADWIDVAVNADVDANRTIVLGGGLYFSTTLTTKTPPTGSANEGYRRVAKLPGPLGFRCAKIDEKTGIWFVSADRRENVLVCDIPSSSKLYVTKDAQGNIETVSGEGFLEIIDVANPAANVAELRVLVSSSDCEFLVLARNDEDYVQVTCEQVSGGGTFKVQVNNPGIDAVLAAARQNVVTLRPPERLTTMA